MLIFFIVTASFVKESAIDTRLPPTATDHRGDVPSIVIDVRANGDIWMGQRRVDASAVRANSERLHAENPKAAVLVRAHVKFSAQTYVALADAARQANVYQVALAPYEDSM